MKKKWFGYSFVSGHSSNDLRDQLAEFANEHQLGPGEIVVTSWVNGDPETLVFMYYAYHDFNTKSLTGR
jgi:hypothetical protein